MAWIDPVGHFEHSHGRLTKLALEVRDLIAAEPHGSPAQLVARVDELSEELLRHFADEEEGLFPFVRRHLPARAGAVDRLQRAHDTVCGALLRLAHLVKHDPRALDASRPAVIALHARFDAAYAEHSRDEAAVLEELGRNLDAGQSTKLAGILRGL
jgi:iron-sulfur cluster repair protein YtfE (RIC family)